MINLDSKKEQLKVKLQLIHFLSDPNVKLTRLELDNPTLKDFSMEEWAEIKKSPVSTITLTLYRKENE